MDKYADSRTLDDQAEDWLTGVYRTRDRHDCDEPEMPLSEMTPLGVVPPGPTLTLAEMRTSLRMGVSYPVMTKASVELREFPPRRELGTILTRIGVGS